MGTDTSSEEMIEVAEKFADLLANAALVESTEKLIMDIRRQRL
ncbi:MAG: hypothetical protein E7A81_01140 [Clostridiales bacterium]|nr:hypothetical protein [Clostridiales bacterium]MDU1041481.1 hypothetical protein [Clostridiales bacterium]